MAIYTVLGPGGYSRPAYGSFLGKPLPPMQPHISTIVNDLQAPVDFVLLGNQTEISKPIALDGTVPNPLSRVFNE